MTNLQHELLRLYFNGVSDETLRELKLLSEFMIGKGN